jgi:hypothetical protein
VDAAGESFEHVAGIQERVDREEETHQHDDQRDDGE